MYRKAESQVTLASRAGEMEKDVLGRMEKVPWWNKRTRMERRSLVLVGILSVLAVLLAVGLVLVARDHMLKPTTKGAPDTINSLQTTNVISVQEPRRIGLPKKPNKNGQDDYCLTKGCILAAAEVLDKIDETVNPCDDFYQFACGSFIEKTVIPDDQSRVSMFSVLGDKLTEQVRGLLEGGIEASDPKAFTLAKALFQSCMNTDAIEERGLAPLTSVLKRLGGWPLLEGNSWNKEEFKWYDMVYRFRDLGYSVDYLVDFSVTTDLKNSSWRVLDVDQPGLGMSREYLMKGLEDKDVQAYFTFMEDVALLLGADKQETDKQMLDVLKFEIKLANISLAREERRDANKLYNPMPISQLTQLDPNTPWLEYINRVLTKDLLQVEESELIIVDAPSYIKHLSDLLAVTPAHVQANYLMWRVVAASMSYLTEEADKIGLKFSKKLTGQSEQPPRWKKCVGAATGSLSNAVGSLYVSKYFDEKSKTTALEMVTEIRSQFESILDQVDWMDDSTKAKAKVKAQGMVEHIGYPPELLDMKKLEDLYDGLELGSDDYFGNALNMTMFGTNYAFSKLREKVNKTDWVRHGNPAVVNAFYSPLENSIQFPAGILQGVFFARDRPLYMNYGAIGWVIGHEITHGFDDQGRQFDQEGNLVDWWHPDTTARYLNKAECIIKQYSDYTFPDLDDLPVNGINTQGENIADNGGIKEAYRAYNSWVAKHGAEPLLPGLNYTQKQLFWISGANVWCSKHRPQALKLSVLTGAHSPDKFRVQGAFSNMAGFSRDFNCREGSKMNPPKKDKCKVW
eukprot:GFUD01040769.1.p1 GENE.GFUD01040769.1~~GFUD01040769.1.p1  ORF type:complete len:795 (-),score=190.06 GFUD01040769.1:142-2526(-)